MKNTGGLIAVVLLIVVIIASTFIYVNNNGGFDLGTMTSITLDAGAKNEAHHISDGLVLYSGNMLFGYDASLVQTWATESRLEEADIVTNGDYVLLYKGSELLLYRGEHLQTTLKLDSDIRYADVNKNGYLTVVSDEKGYRAKCVVYDKNGKESFRYFSGENHIVGAKLSHNNLVLAINMMYLGGAQPVSIVSFVDVNSGESFYEHAYTDNTISDVSFIRSNQAIALGDKYLLSYTSKGKERFRYDYDGQNLQKILYRDGIIAVLSRPGLDSTKTELTILDYAGRKKGAYSSQMPIEYIDISKGYVAVTEGQDIKMLNKSGEIVGTCVTASPISDILLFDTNNRVCVLSNSYLRSEKFDR